jgi:peptidoglycan/LPS O-acetylase OafA/YrhL
MFRLRVTFFWESFLKKWQIIDLTRSFCVIAVMGVHIWSNAPFSNRWVCWMWGTFCVNGFYGVFLFFMISGFLITYVIDQNPGGFFRPSLGRFYIQRIGRIWPLFFACVGAGFLIFLTAPKNSFWYLQYFVPGGDYGLWFWISIFTFLFNWFLISENLWAYPAQWVILWSLAIEEQFYFLYPLVLKKMRDSKRFLVFLFLIILAAVLWRVIFYFSYPGNGFIQSYGSPGKFDLMAMGILLYLTLKRYGGIFSRNRWLSVFLCLGGLSLTLLVYFGTRETNRLSEIFVPELLGLGLFGFLLGGLHLSFFESKYLKILSLPGKYCYGCYLLHSVVLFFIRPFLAGLNIFLAFFLFIVATTLTASISYHFFEMPMNRWIRKSFGQL